MAMANQDTRKKFTEAYGPSVSAHGYLALPQIARRLLKKELPHAEWCVLEELLFWREWQAKLNKGRYSPEVRVTASQLRESVNVKTDDRIYRLLKSLEKRDLIHITNNWYGDKPGANTHDLTPLLLRLGVLSMEQDQRDATAKMSKGEAAATAFEAERGALLTRLRAMEPATDYARRELREFIAHVEAHFVPSNPTELECVRESLAKTESMIQSLLRDEALAGVAP